MMFSWLAELVPVFWLMKLELIFLKGSAASSSRFWSVYGFSMPLGSRSSFHSVKHIYFHSGFKVALSAYLQCHQPPTCPWDHCWCFYSPVLPCAVGPNLLGRCLCGSFCIAVTCVDSPQPPKLTFCVAGLACTCFGSPGLTFALWGLCALVSASHVHTLRQGPCVHLFQLPCLPSVSQSCVHLFRLTASTLCCRGYLFFFLQGGLCELPKFIYLPSIGTPVPRCTNCVCCITLGYLVLPSVLQGLCTLAGFVCPVTFGYLGPPSVLQGLNVLAGFVCHHSQFPKHAVWSHSL